MKRVLYLYMLFFATSCSQWNYPYEYMQNIINAGRNPDYSQYVYVIDSIPYDSINFSIIYNRTNHKGFYVSNDFLKKHRKIKDSDVLDENFAIYKSGMSDSWLGLSYEDEYLPQRPTYVKFNDEWDIMKAHGLEYFRMYLIRGDVFNIEHTQVMDANNSPYLFPYRSGYYRIVSPVQCQEK